MTWERDSYHKLEKFPTPPDPELIDIGKAINRAVNEYSLGLEQATKSYDELVATYRALLLVAVGKEPGPHDDPWGPRSKEEVVERLAKCHQTIQTAQTCFFQAAHELSPYRKEFAAKSARPERL